MNNNSKNGVELACRGEHPAQISRMNSGWVVLANKQYLRVTVSCWLIPWFLQSTILTKNHAAIS